ncbi:hypothetical protein [Azohydromonas lata]|uniref:hypothetical protein n=1 Tax=Azohydromonas lata TaxID=45677 RepID=UPI000A6DD515|nr:hypothetical protein [Azohydromonas lata]
MTWSRGRTPATGNRQLQLQLQLQMVECLVNGSEAARCLRSRWPGPQTFSTGIELHSLRAGALHARFFH